MVVHLFYIFIAIRNEKYSEVHPNYIEVWNKFINDVSMFASYLSIYIFVLFYEYKWRRVRRWLIVQNDVIFVCFVCLFSCFYKFQTQTRKSQQQLQMQQLQPMQRRNVLVMRSKIGRPDLLRFGDTKKTPKKFCPSFELRATLRCLSMGI